MTKLTILSGISGSGKSTWADEHCSGKVVVSRDAIRAALFMDTPGQSYYHRPDIAECEGIVTLVEHQAIGTALRNGYDVISDNTNIENEFVRLLAYVARDAGAEVELVEFECGLYEALDRVRQRAEAGGRWVPESVMRRQYRKFKGTHRYLPKLVRP